MSASELRRAAALIRERAEAARAGRWVAEAEHILAQWADVRHVAECSGSIPEGNDANARHIASWHPAVAFALADWLDDMSRWGDLETETTLEAVSMRHALAVVRAYLGAAS